MPGDDLLWTVFCICATVLAAQGVRALPRPGREEQPTMAATITTTWVQLSLFNRHDVDRWRNGPVAALHPSGVWVNCRLLGL